MPQLFLRFVGKHYSQKFTQKKKKKKYRESEKQEKRKINPRNSIKNNKRKRNRNEHYACIELLTDTK